MKPILIKERLDAFAAEVKAAAEEIGSNGAQFNETAKDRAVELFKFIDERYYAAQEDIGKIVGKDEEPAIPAVDPADKDAMKNAPIADGVSHTGFKAPTGGPALVASTFQPAPLPGAAPSPTNPVITQNPDSAKIMTDADGNLELTVDAAQGVAKAVKPTGEAAVSDPNALQTAVDTAEGVKATAVQSSVVVEPTPAKPTGDGK